MSVGIRSRTERPAYEETSEHFHVGVALPWSAEEPNAPLSSPALARRVRPRTWTLNTGASRASVMREDRDGVDFSHGTLSMITGSLSERASLSLSPGPRRITGQGDYLLFLGAGSTKRFMQRCSKPRGQQLKLAARAVL